MHGETGGLCNKQEVPEGCYAGAEQAGGGRLWFRDAPAAPSNKPATSKPAKPALPMASSGEVDRVYRRGAELMPLPAAVASEVAEQRGLSPERIAELGFAYLPGHWKRRGDVLGALEREFGRTLLLKVPGFVFKGDKLDFSLSGSGLVIPHRDPAGNVLALQVRLDRVPKGKPRYQWLSGNGGPSIPAAPYLAGEAVAGGRVLLTEGAFKAIAGADRFGTFAVGLPGASMLGQALPLLKEVSAGEVLLAYDADHAELKPNGKPNHIFGWLRSAVRNLRAEGFTVSLLRWHRGAFVDGETPKGLDDALSAGTELEELQGDQVDQHLRGVAELLGVVEETSRPQAEEPLSELEVILLPVAALEPEYRGTDLQDALRDVAGKATGLDVIARACLLSDLQRHLKRIKAPGAADLARLTVGAPAEEEDKGGLKIRATEPCPEKVAGAELLDQVEKLLLRFAILPEGASVAIPLWLLHTYLIPRLNFTPRLAVLSPVKRCGKSTLLNLLQELAEKAMVTSSVTAAALFRAMDAYSPTIIADEADTWLKENEELRGVVNTGFHRPNAYIHRCQGDAHELKSFATFGAMAIAGIGRLPDTIQDRSIIVSMRRKRPGEEVERLRQDVLQAAAKEVKPRLARWATDNAEEVRAAQPELPRALHDRAADCWEPLLAIADLAGGAWPKRARQAALVLSGADVQQDEDIGVMLLSDIRDIFERRRTDRIRSSSLLENLCSFEERPWCEWKKGQPLSPRGLSNLLRPFGVSVKNYRDTFGEQGKGYLLECFEDAFGRYLGGSVTDQKASPSQAPPILSVTSVTSSNGAGLRDSLSVTSSNPVTDRKVEKTAWLSRVTDVTDRNPGGGERKLESESFEECIPLADLLGDLP